MEQTYHEWVNSVYNDDNVSCQACHVPRIDDAVVIGANYLFLQGAFSLWSASILPVPIPSCWSC